MGARYRRNCRGHSLKSLKGLNTRPTLDKVKEAIFNVISSRITGSAVLDLFAGTGALGIEALSRGAETCLFNDRQRKACEIIRENLIKCRLMDGAQVFNMDALKLLRHLQEEGLKLDLVFLDPPYESGFYVPSLEALVNMGLLGKNALVIVETDLKNQLPEEIITLKLIKTSRYGDTLIRYYESMEE